VNKLIKIIHVITRMDMGGSAQNTLLTALHHDSRNYNVWLIKGSTLESAMTKAETELVENQLETAKVQGIEIIDVPSLVRRISPTVTSRKRTREGRGFSRNELLQVGLSFGEALRLGIPIDKRRNTVYEENVTTLKNWVNEIKD